MLNTLPCVSVLSDTTLPRILQRRLACSVHFGRENTLSNKIHTSDMRLSEMLAYIFTFLSEAVDTVLRISLLALERTCHTWGGRYDPSFRDCRYNQNDSYWIRTRHQETLYPAKN